MIDVLVVTTEPPNEILGGMGEHIRNLYRSMSLDGLATVRIATTHPNTGVDILHGYEIHYTDPVVTYKPSGPEGPMIGLFMGEFKHFKLCCRMINERKPDVIHLHESLAAHVGLEVAELYNIPTISTLHLCGTELWMDKMNWGVIDRHYKHWEGKIVERSDEIIAISKDYAKIPYKWYRHERAINTIHNGVWYDDWKIARRQGDDRWKKIRETFPQDKKLVLLCGRISTQKGIQFIPKMVELSDEFCYILMGDLNAHDEEEAWLNWPPARELNRVVEKYPDRIRKVAFQRGDDRYHWFAAMDYVLMPSIHEPFGIVALEAMAANKPLICSTHSGLKEFTKDDWNALTPHVDNDDILGTSERLLRALERVSSEHSLRNKIIKNGDETARLMDWSIVAKKTVEVYKNAIKGKQNATVEYTYNPGCSNTS